MTLHFSLVCLVWLIRSETVVTWKSYKCVRFKDSTEIPPFSSVLALSSIWAWWQPCESERAGALPILGREVPGTQDGGQGWCLFPVPAAESFTRQKPARNTRARSWTLSLPWKTALRALAQTSPPHGCESFHFTACQSTLAVGYSFPLSKPLSQTAPDHDNSCPAQLPRLPVTKWQSPAEFVPNSRDTWGHRRSRRRSTRERKKEQ